MSKFEHEGLRQHRNGFSGKCRVKMMPVRVPYRARDVPATCFAATSPYLDSNFWGVYFDDLSSILSNSFKLRREEAGLRLCLDTESWVQLRRSWSLRSEHVCSFCLSSNPPCLVVKSPTRFSFPLSPFQTQRYSTLYRGYRTCRSRNRHPYWQSYTHAICGTVSSPHVITCQALI